MFKALMGKRAVQNQRLIAATYSSAMSVLAKSVLVTGGTFVNHEAASASQRGWDTLFKNVAQSTLHNAAERYDAPKCHEGTRVAVIKRIVQWVQDLTIIQTFMWMYGPAGAGKSAIAQSVAEMCRSMDIWTIIFFFSRHAAERSNDKHLIATLAYQIYKFIPEMRDAIGAAVDRNPAIFNETLSTQLKELVTDPLAQILQNDAVHRRLSGRHLFIILDGLDESGDGATHKRILDALCSSLSSFKIHTVCLIASRPEFAIRQGFQKEPLQTLTIRLPLDDDYQADEDIQKFLEDKFAEIKATHILRQYLDPLWPGEETVRTLIRNSSGQFIYASTVMKYIESGGHHPDDGLQTVLQLLDKNDDETPFATLDALYTEILLRVSNRSCLIEILSYLMYATQWYDSEAEEIDKILCYRPGKTILTLCDMHALLRIPSGRRERIEFYHASLGDFLSDKSRSGVFFLNPQVQHAKLACKAIKYLTGKSNLGKSAVGFLLHGIFDLCENTTLSSDIGDLGKYLCTDLFSVVLKYPLDSGGFSCWKRGKSWLQSQEEDHNMEIALTAKSILQYYQMLEDSWLESIFKTLHPRSMSAFVAFIHDLDINTENSSEIPMWLKGHEWAEMLEDPEIGEDDRDIGSILDGELSLLYVLPDDGAPWETLGDRLEVIRKYLVDHKRSGPYSFDNTKRSIMCHRLAKWLFKRHAGSLLTSRDQISIGDDATWAIIYCADLLCNVLQSAPKSEELYEALRNVVLVVPESRGSLWQHISEDCWSESIIQNSLKNVAFNTLKYIKRCEFPYPEHMVHPDEGVFYCAICADQ